MDETLEVLSPPSSTDEGEKVPESPKPLAFTIDFGEEKSINNQRLKSMVEKYQKKHRRGQSLSKIEDASTSTTAIKKPPQCLSGNLPRKSNYLPELPNAMSSMEKSTRGLNMLKLELPLKNTTTDKFQCSSPEDLKNGSTEDEEQISPSLLEDCRRLSSPDKNDVHEFVEGTEFDFDISDAVSDAGTYTLDADNYSEEQKARMSIDHKFEIEEVSVFRKTQEYVQSLATLEQEVTPVEEEAPTPVQKPQTLSFAQNNQPSKLSPIVSPTQNISIMQYEGEPKPVNFMESTNRTFSKIMMPSPKARTGIGLEKEADHGNIISITSSGAFRTKEERDRINRRKLSLAKSEIQVQTYISNNEEDAPKDVHELKPLRRNLSANLVLVSENVPQTINNIKSKNALQEEIVQTNVSVGKVVNLPPCIGGMSGKNSPTKIPSPIHTSRPRSRTSSNSLNVDLSDSSLETESYLRPTQCLLNSLQQKLSMENSDNDCDNYETKYLNNDARNLLKKPTHIRHNSLDDRNMKTNKLEHFQNKNFIDQSYANVLNQYSHGKVHKIQNSPNNSPIRRSSSFSTKNHINTKCSNITQKESNIRNSPNLGRNGSIQRSSSTATMRSSMLIRHADHRMDRNQFGETESSSEEDLKHNIRKKDITNTRYNRAFSLRRGRLESESPPGRCPNTPEMHRKFQPNEHIRSERAISVDRKPKVSSNEVQSKYLQNLSKPKTVQLKAEVKLPQKIGNLATKPSPKPQVFSRTDTGRFSMRTNKPPPVTNSQKTIRKEIPVGKKPSGPRSNSSLTSKEVDFQNWKRRKSYDPRKAAAEGKRKAELAKKNSTPMTQSYHEANQDCDSSPSHSSSVHRSQSFHGTAALEQYVSSEEEEEDLTLSPDEGFSPPTPSPCDMSPNHVNLRYAWKDPRLHHHHH